MMGKVSQKRKVIYLRRTRSAQLEILDKMVAKIIEEGKAQVKRIISDINSYYRDELFRIVGEDDTSVTFQFETIEVSVTENGILTGNGIHIANDEGKVYIHVPKLVGDGGRQYNIQHGRVQIKVKAKDNRLICEVTVWFPPLKLREIALKELEKKLERYQSL